MNQQMQSILKSKQRERSRLAALPISEKIAILEKLRDRALAIAGSSLYRTQGSRSGKAWVLRETQGSE